MFYCSYFRLYICIYISYIFALHLVSSRLAIAVLCLNCKNRLRTLCVTKWKVVASFVSRCVMVSFSSVFAGERERRGGGGGCCFGGGISSCLHSLIFRCQTSNESHCHSLFSVPIHTRNGLELYLKMITIT